MNEEVAVVRLHVTGPPAAVDRVVENLQTAELPWLEVQDVSDATLLMGQARRHVTALVPVGGRLVLLPSPFGAARLEPGL
jgi:hypothetical protein